MISPAAEQCGYAALRADQISEPGLITSQVIQHIVDDPLLIADLTDRNPNVFYELAIRHALRKPLVQIIRRGEQIPFDVAGTRTIPVDHQDLESVEEAKAEIVRQIEHLEKKPQDVETPISVALELQFLRQSENPKDRSLAELVSTISEIRSELANLQKNLSYRLVDMLDKGAHRTEDLMMMMKEALHEMRYRDEDRFMRYEGLLKELESKLFAIQPEPLPEDKKA